MSGSPEPRTTIREELAEIRTELKWVKWLAGGALMTSAVGQLTSLPVAPSALVDLLTRLF